MTLTTPDKKLLGYLLGTAVGDALGLPYEGLSKRRAQKLLGEPERHRFVFGYGMISDVTEHACLTAQAYIEAKGDKAAFEALLARNLRHWLLCLPAGVGMATLRSIIKLWCGISPQKSGVYSAGNGTAMRAVILGAVVEEGAQLRELVEISSRMTHTDPKATFGSLVVALASQYLMKTEEASPRGYIEYVKSSLPDIPEELLTRLTQMLSSLESNEDTEAFAQRIGCFSGVSGYIYDTVPVALHAWLSHPFSYRAAVTSVIRCGGDTHSTAAIVGGLVGIAVGEEGIPKEWRDAILEWHYDREFFASLARSLTVAYERSPSVIRGVLLRNLLFLSIVIFHGFRRLLPPY